MERGNRLHEKKQGIVIALSLPENDENQIREKVFDQIKNGLRMRKKKSHIFSREKKIYYFYYYKSFSMFCS